MYPELLLGRLATLDSLLGLTLLGGNGCVVHHRGTDEDRSICSDQDTEDEGDCKTPDGLTTEDGDCEHGHEGRDGSVDRTWLSDGTTSQES